MFPVAIPDPRMPSQHEKSQIRLISPIVPSLPPPLRYSAVTRFGSSTALTYDGFVDVVASVGETKLF